MRKNISNDIVYFKNFKSKIFKEDDNNYMYLTANAMLVNGASVEMEILKIHLDSVNININDDISIPSCSRDITLEFKCMPIDGILMNLVDKDFKMKESL